MRVATLTRPALMLSIMFIRPICKVRLFMAVVNLVTKQSSTRPKGWRLDCVWWQTAEHNVHALYKVLANTTGLIHPWFEYPHENCNNLAESMPKLPTYASTSVLRALFLHHPRRGPGGGYGSSCSENSWPTIRHTWGRPYRWVLVYFLRGDEEIAVLSHH